MINKLKKKLLEKKAQLEVQKIFSKSDEAANLLLPLPLFIWEVKFEFLFLFYFLYDYRVFHKYDELFKIAILDEFIKKVILESGISEEAVNELYNQRVNQYWNMLKAARTFGDFSQPAVSYIEALVIYLREENQFSAEPPEVIIDKVNQILPDKVGSLTEPIRNAIAMHSNELIF